MEKREKIRQIHWIYFNIFNRLFSNFPKNLEYLALQPQNIRFLINFEMFLFLISSILIFWKISRELLDPLRLPFDPQLPSNNLQHQWIRFIHLFPYFQLCIPARFGSSCIRMLVLHKYIFYLFICSPFKTLLCLVLPCQTEF